MHARFWLGLLWLSCFGNANAQQVTAGLKAGGLLTTITHPIARTAHWQPGYHGGGFLQLWLSERVAGQIELLYLRQGGRADSATATGTLTEQVRLHSIGLPVLAKVYVGGTSLNLQAGGQASFLLYATSERSLRAGTLVSSSSLGNGAREVTARFRTVDLAAVGGIGLDLAAGVTISARYVLGLRDVTADPVQAQLRAQQHLPISCNRGVQLAAGWRFL